MTWLIANLNQVAGLLLIHLGIAIPAILLSVAIAVPIGRLAHASGPVRSTLLSTTGVLYAIPSLPLLIVVPMLTGLPLRSPATMIVALTVYGVALLARSAADAFAAVPADALTAATAIGHTRAGRFLGVELPLALPIIVAGTRVVAMSTVGLITIGSLVGIPSLGSLLTEGFQRGIPAEVATGIVLTLALALAIDAAIRILGRLSTPWITVVPVHREGAEA